MKIVVINSKDYARITNSFIYLAKIREPMKRHELIGAFLAENESTIESERSDLDQQSKAENVLPFLIGKEGILFISEENIYVHPNYDGKLIKPSILLLIKETLFTFPF